jgi:predicted RNase H-like nuclease (RuvC/YqgF family)
MADWYKRLRINTLTLVKQGFTREEIFFMPLTEIQDYIRILNNNIEEEQNEIDKMKAESSSSNNINDLKMAGNTMPF